ncbi:hypothetical protein [Streptomyces sp. NPDC056244]|uniref:hypothetical protein n=1 Tax=unclassified Streptomyces TaxID=2593676 RepID=UPI0035D6EEBA
MARTYRRKTALAALSLLAATTLLTACQQGTSDSAAASSAPSAPAAADPVPAGAEADADATDAPDAAPATDSPAEGTGSPAEVPAAADGAQANGKGKGVSGTWFGNVSYLAPSKYTVSDMKGAEQIFFVAVDTDIVGTGDICGVENSKVDAPCTEAELETAAKAGVSAEVTIKDGVAVRIVDDH